MAARIAQLLGQLKAAVDHNTSDVYQAPTLVFHVMPAVDSSHKDWRVADKRWAGSPAPNWCTSPLTCSHLIAPQQALRRGYLAALPALLLRDGLWCRWCH